MGLQVDRDYGPITVSNIVDKQGNPAQIDGAVTYVLGAARGGDGNVIPDATVGTIVTASGDPRPEFPDGAIVYVTANAVGSAVAIDAHCDPNLNPEITDDKVIARFDDVLIGGDAAVGVLSLGGGVPK